MRRTVTLGTLWLTAAVVAVAVAWQGVAVVGDQVTDERPAALAASEIEARLAEASTTTTTATDATSPASSPAPSTTSGPTSTAPTTPMAPLTPTSTTTAAPPPTTAAAGETRTYNLQGGTASLRFSPTGVEVVFAKPADGFSVEVEPEHGNGVKVEFESDAHESRVDGWWDGGPVDRIREGATD